MVLTGRTGGGSGVEGQAPSLSFGTVCLGGRPVPRVIETAQALAPDIVPKVIQLAPGRHEPVVIAVDRVGVAGPRRVARVGTHQGDQALGVCVALADIDRQCRHCRGVAEA